MRLDWECGKSNGDTSATGIDSQSQLKNYCLCHASETRTEPLLPLPAFWCPLMSELSREQLVKLKSGFAESQAQDYKSEHRRVFKLRDNNLITGIVLNHITEHRLHVFFRNSRLSFLFIMLKPGATYCSMVHLTWPCKKSALFQPPPAASFQAILLLPARKSTFINISLFPPRLGLPLVSLPHTKLWQVAQPF